MSAMNTLAELPEDRLGSPEPWYLLRLGDSLRAVVQPMAGGKPEIVDIFRHETLEWLFNRPGNKASHE